MKARILRIAFVSLISVPFVSLPSLSLAEPPQWAGGGNSGGNPDPGGGNSGGKGDKPSDPGPKKGELYGDLYVIDRDQSGVPILYSWDTGEPKPDSSGFTNPITDGLEVLVDCYPAANNEGCLIPLDSEGEVLPEFEQYVQEVEFGRMNLGRAPLSVLDRQLHDALILLQNASTVSFDPAGRLVADGFTIDSPLQNLALYQNLMLNGILFYDEPGDTADISIDLEALTDRDYLSIAASLLGAAADKTGEITVDLVVYENAILGIPTSAKGSYFDYSAFSYSRSETFPGCVIYAVSDGSGLGWTDPPVNYMNAVFNGISPENLTNIAAFAQAADDARAMVEFLHSQLIYDIDFYGADLIGEEDVCSLSASPSPTIQILSLPTGDQQHQSW